MADLKVGDIVVQTLNNSVWWLKEQRSASILRGVCVHRGLRRTETEYSPFSVNCGSDVVRVGHSPTKPTIDYDAAIAAAALLK